MYSSKRRWIALSTGVKRRNRSLTLIFVSALVISCTYLLFSDKTPLTRSIEIPRLGELRFSSFDGTGSNRDRKLVVLVPADNSGPDLCKLLLSAIALGYPAPTIVNWRQDFSQRGGGKWAPFLAKITGPLNYLDHVTHSDADDAALLDDEDLVLILDAYDIWFQLPPAVLLHRYHETNRMANARLYEEWTSTALGDMPMQQTIIISSQRRCFPELNSGSDLHCDELPHSTLPPNLYGEDTDANPDNYHDNRPRWVNSGSFMGPIGHMKRYFRAAKNKMDKQISDELPFDGDQGIFGEVFGEQEVWRQWRRGTESNNTSDLASALIQRDFEYHLGLDYTQQLFLPTIYGEEDGFFVSLNDSDDIKRQSEQRNISPPRLEGIPHDLANVSNPLSAITDAGAQPNWDGMPLYADFYTTAVPALIHHNAWRHGLKQRRVEWWDKTWFFAHLRDLVTAHLRPAAALLATINAGDHQQRYLLPTSHIKENVPRIYASQHSEHSMTNADFDEICKYPDDAAKPSKEMEWYDEVFRDSKGALKTST